MVDRLKMGGEAVTVSGELQKHILDAQILPLPSTIPPAAQAKDFFNLLILKTYCK